MLCIVLYCSIHDELICPVLGNPFANIGENLVNTCNPLTSSSCSY